MKIFRMDNTDCGRSSIVCAEGTPKAIELFKKAHNTYPERVIEITTDGETVIIEYVFEPVYTVPY